MKHRKSVLKLKSASGNFLYVSEMGWDQLKSIFNKIADNFGRPRPKFFANKWLLNIAWLISAIKDWILNSKSAITRESARGGDSGT